MEEFQEIARPEKMGSVVLRGIVRIFPVYGLMVSNAKGSTVFRNSSRGTYFRPKNWIFVARKWQKNAVVFKATGTQSSCGFYLFW